MRPGIYLLFIFALQDHVARFMQHDKKEDILGELQSIDQGFV